MAADEAADKLANQELQQDPHDRPQRESERGEGPGASAEHPTGPDGGRRYERALPAAAPVKAGAGEAPAS